MQEIVSLLIILIGSIVGFFAMVQKGIEERERNYNDNVRFFR